MNTLQEGLKRRALKNTSAATPKKRSDKPSRAGRVLIGGHFDVSVRERLLAIRMKDSSRTTQDLLEEALDLLFERHKQPRLR